MSTNESPLNQNTSSNSEYITARQSITKAEPRKRNFGVLRSSLQRSTARESHRTDLNPHEIHHLRAAKVSSAALIVLHSSRTATSDSQWLQQTWSPIKQVCLTAWLNIQRHCEGLVIHLASVEVGSDTCVDAPVFLLHTGDIIPC